MLVKADTQNKHNAIYYTTATKTVFTGNSETLGKF